MGFWRKLDAESLKTAGELSPLTDETIVACEKKFGVKLPGALVDLLRTKNGGFLENKDFQINGKNFGVAEISGLDPAESWSALRPCSSFLDADDEMNWRGQLESQAGDASKLLCFADDDPYYYLLDYNHLNSAGAPTILGALMDEGLVDISRIADSIEDFLKGQYAGDPEPLIRMADARRYRVIAEGGYQGTLHSTGAAVRIRWQICSHRSRLIVFQSEDWGWGEKRERFELSKGALDWKPVALEDYGVELEPDFAELIRPTVEAKCLEVADYDVPLTPECFQLHICLPMGRPDTITRVGSEAFEGRWKNSSSGRAVVTLYSADKTALEATILKIAKNSRGLKQFFS